MKTRLFKDKEQFFLNVNICITKINMIDSRLRKNILKTNYNEVNTEYLYFDLSFNVCQKYT